MIREEADLVKRPTISAHNYCSLPEIGITVRKTIGVITATFCIVEGLALLHVDHDSDPMASHVSFETATP